MEGVNATANSGSTSLLFASIFTVGDLVIVDGQNRGYITERKFNENNELLFTVLYLHPNSTEYNIKRNRLKLITNDTLSFTRSGTNHNINITTTNNTTTANSSTSTPTTLPAVPNPITPPRPAHNTNSDRLIQTELETCLLESFLPSPDKNCSIQLLFLFLESNKSKRKGWIRKVINKKTTSPDKQLNEKEKFVCTIMSSIFSGFNPRGGPYKGFNKILNHTFGVSRAAVAKDILHRFIKQDFSLKRKI